MGNVLLEPKAIRRKTPQGRTSLAPFRSTPEEVRRREGTRNSTRAIRRRIPERISQRQARRGIVLGTAPGGETPKDDSVRRTTPVRNDPRMGSRWKPGARNSERCGPKAGPEGGVPEVGSASSQQTSSRQRGSGPESVEPGTATVSPPRPYRGARRIQAVSVADGLLPLAPKDDWSRGRVEISTPPHGRLWPLLHGHSASAVATRREPVPPGALCFAEQEPCCAPLGWFDFRQGTRRSRAGAAPDARRSCAGHVESPRTKASRWGSPRMNKSTRGSFRRVTLTSKAPTGASRRAIPHGARCRARVLPCRHVSTCSPRHVGRVEDGIETIDPGPSSFAPDVREHLGPLDESSGPRPPSSARARVGRAR